MHTSAKFEGRAKKTGFSSYRLHLLGVGCEDSELGPRTAVLTEVFEIRASLQPMF